MGVNREGSNKQNAAKALWQGRWQRDDDELTLARRQRRRRGTLTVVEASMN